MGRPPIGEQAMSGAERVRRHRKKSKQTVNDSDLLKLRAMNDQCESALDRLEARAANPQRQAMSESEHKAEVAEVKALMVGLKRAMRLAKRLVAAWERSRPSTSAQDKSVKPALPISERARRRASTR
jgi:hypothetical protein